jgi:hypothetical protein
VDAMIPDDDYVLSILAGLSIYGLLCVGVGYWLRASISKALREIFQKERMR